MTARFDFERTLTLAVLVGALAAALPSAANVYTFTLPAGAKETGGNAVSGTAVFTTLATGHISVDITDTLVNPKTVAQNISDLFFTVGTGQTTGTSGYTSSGRERTINSNGTFTDGSLVSSGWLLGTSGSQLHLDDLNGGAGPKHTIVGSPNASNVYSNANSSLAGNGAHNPFLAGTVHFDFAMTGVTANTTISNVVFSFGTTAGDNVSTVPEPAYYQAGALFGLGGLGLIRSLRSRRRSAN